MAKNKAPKKTPTAKPEDEDAEGQEGSEGEDDNDEDPEEENRRINAIVTSRVKREMKGVLSTLAQIQESMKTLAGKSKPEDEDDDEDQETPAEGAKPAKIAEDPKTSRKLSKLEKELAEEREARKKAEKDRSEEQERTKRGEMRTLFQQALADHGVTDPKLQRAALNLLEEDGYMIRDEDGKVKFKGQDKYGIETLYDPKSGLKGWVLSEGKSFVPAVDAGGSGAGGSRNPVHTQNLTKGEFGKLTPQQKASIELERASMGLAPLE